MFDKEDVAMALIVGGLVTIAILASQARACYEANLEFQLRQAGCAKAVDPVAMEKR